MLQYEDLSNLASPKNTRCNTKLDNNDDVGPEIVLLAARFSSLVLEGEDASTRDNITENKFMADGKVGKERCIYKDKIKSHFPWIIIM